MHNCWRESFVPVGGGATSLGARGTMDTPGEGGQFAEFFGRLERTAPVDDGYVPDGGAVQDVERGGRVIVLVENVRRSEENPPHVECDVALSDHGHMLCPVERWCW